MEDIDAIKWLLEGGGFGICILITWLLIKRFVKKDILEAIETATATAKSAEKAVATFEDRSGKMFFKFQNELADTRSSFSADLGKMSKLFSEATQYAGGAMVAAKRAEENIAEALKVSKENTDKFLEVGRALNNKIEKLKTEVVAVKDDLVFVKNKKGN